MEHDPDGLLVSGADPPDPLHESFSGRRIALSKLLTVMFGNTFKAGKKQVIPVRAWAVVTLLAGLIFLGFGYFDLPNANFFKNTHEMRYHTYKIRLHNLRRTESSQPDTYRVLIFGSSLTAQGVMRDSFFTERFQQLGLPVQVSRIFYAGAFYKMLEDPDLLDYLGSVQPDLLCIEDQVLLYDPLPGLDWPEPLFSTLHQNFVFNLNTLKHLMLPTVFPEPGLGKSVDSNATFDVKYPQADSIISHLDSTEYTVEMRTIRRMGRTKKFNTLAQQLKENGQSVTIIQMPRPQPVEAAFLAEKSLKRREQLLQDYHDNYGIDYWHFPKSMPFQYYWDLSHMNKHGQLIYSDWLFQHILGQYQRQR